MGLRAKARKARRKFHAAKRKKDDTRPKSDRRRKLAKLVRFWRDRKDRLVARIDKRRHHTSVLSINTSLGPPHWGGAADVMHRLVYPIADRYGLPWEGDDKEYGHAVGGDHDPNVSNAFAEDFPTFSGAAFARAVAARLGNPSGGVGTYTPVYFYVDGVRFRAQILWAVSGHYNHVHIGIRRA